MVQYLTHLSSAALALHVIGYLVAGFISWYLLSALNYGLNSGQLGRHPYLFPFQCFVEELPCYWFGGKKHRIEFIKCRCHGNGTFLGSKRSFDHKEIRENNLYEVVFWEMCGGRISFWGGHLFQFFFGPPLTAMLLLMSLVGFLLLPVRWLFGKVARSAS